VSARAANNSIQLNAIEPACFRELFESCRGLGEWMQSLPLRTPLTRRSPLPIGSIVYTAWQALVATGLVRACWDIRRRISRTAVTGDSRDAPRVDQLRVCHLQRRLVVREQLIVAALGVVADCHATRSLSRTRGEVRGGSSHRSPRSARAHH
jgi:hypothetical protein